MKKRFTWSDLPEADRRRIAERGAGDCRSADAPFEKIIPCKGCGCWLVEAYRYARQKHLDAARLQRAAAAPRNFDASAGVPYAAGSEKTTEEYLQRLRNHHPEREVRADVA